MLLRSLVDQHFTTRALIQTATGNGNPPLLSRQWSADREPLFNEGKNMAFCGQLTVTVITFNEEQQDRTHNQQ